MKIETAEFVRSAMRPDQFPRGGLPEIAFAGRSNVGKSTLLNHLLARRGLARISSTPGRTQAVNYFLINQRLHFVDLPGYGFAKASKSARQSWARLMEAYFARSSGNADQSVLLIQLIDGKVGATDLDCEADRYFESLDLPTLKVATKIDKVPRSRRERNLRAIRQSLELSEDMALVPFSAVSGEGVRQLWRGITTFLENREKRQGKRVHHEQSY